MKEYIKMFLNGGTHICIETDQPSIHWIFFGSDDEIFPFEGNFGKIYEPTDESYDETYWISENDSEIFLQANTIPNSKSLLVTFSNHNQKIYQYIENYEPDYAQKIFEYLDENINAQIQRVKASGNDFDGWSRCVIWPTIYKLNDAWLIFNSEIVYGKHPHSIEIIAKDLQRAREIEDLLFSRMRSSPLSHRSRFERFKYNKELDNYNASEECNKLRHKYLKIIKHAYEKFDFSEIFEHLDDKCTWCGAHGKDDVITSLKARAIQMKKNNSTHKCTIVQVGNPISPLEFNTKSDGLGDVCFVALFYNSGEICMVEETKQQWNFFRMSLSLNGKILSYYATLPSGNFHILENDNNS